MEFSLFDAHCDTASFIYEKKLDLFKNSGHVDLKRGVKLNNYAQFFAMWTNETHSRGLSFEECFSAQLEYFLRQIRKYSDKIEICTGKESAETANTAGKIAAFLSAEDAALLGCDINNLETAYLKGLRSVTLTWNHKNALACGNKTDYDSGLTKKGREFVLKAHELGILVDLSHIGERSFWEVCEISKRPVIASHSNSKTVCNHPRNLTDEQFKAIIALDGFAGITLYAPFLNPDGAKITDILRHIERFLALGGEKHIGIGADFDGCDEFPAGIKGIQSMEILFETMLRMNYGEDIVRGIFYDNLMRVVENICGI